MNGIITSPGARTQRKAERPRLHKVILLNDDYTPREFVVTILKAEFRMSEEQALRVMITAHRRGACRRRLHKGRRRSQGNELD
jgi:ATP-dependent Clp protease adaptor protein ClpS